MKLPIATVAVFLASFTVAQAEQNCGDLTNQTDMNICAGKAYKASDAELNKVYRKIQARLKDDADTAKLLVSTQKAWIGFRDAECKFSSSGVEGGSVYPFVSSSCLDAMTKSRIEDLKVYLDCEEGDMSCPVPAAD
ncbi:lysozyme inhibitor LprI family protein [Nitratireductor soli]|uniref:lysozyme inhibitor LprI family protein n=1 Tax=Nitratireductor soli TaxID=1670619 RepID=UPI00065E017C|nr:lysozyme inhibitor LprI family protein [Nitratireductor soli]